MRESSGNIYNRQIVNSIYRMSVDHSVLDETDNFPYPAIITRDDFSASEGFNPDSYLYHNHRFTALDSLLNDLKALSKNTNQELLDLVNNEYASFINLGRSITGSLELINNVSADVAKFNAIVLASRQSLQQSSSTVDKALQKKQELNLLKNRAKLILLLNEQCTSFESLLGFTIGRDSQRLKDKVSTLATLYLSVTKIYAVLEESNSILCAFFENNCKSKLGSIRYEFKAFLHEIMEFMKLEPQKYGDVILLVLHCYRITGSLTDYLK